MNKNIILLAVGAGLLVGSYHFGHSNAETEGQLAIEELKLKHKNEVAETQAKIRGDLKTDLGISPKSVNHSKARSAIK